MSALYVLWDEGGIPETLPDRKPNRLARIVVC